MPLFRSWRKDASPVSPTKSPPGTSRSNSIKSTDSLQSSSSKLKLFRSKNTPSPAEAPAAATSPAAAAPKIHISSPLVPDKNDSPEAQTSSDSSQNDQASGTISPNTLLPNRIRKRISTIVESEHPGSEFSGSEDSDSGSDESGSEFDSDSDSSDEEEDEHSHIVKVRGQVSQHHLAAQLSTIMGYCGITLSSSKDLREQADEESRYTYSLLDDKHKIHHLPASHGSTQSVIDDHQIKLIENLTAKATSFLKACQIQGACPALRGKTLYQRYGVVQDMIGRGAYGVIKLIESNPENEPQSSESQLYAVKEIMRKSNKEPNDKFVERVLSEFIISSTLNSKYIVKTVDLMVTLPKSTSPIKFSQVMECTPGGDLFTYLTTTSDKNGAPVDRMSMDEVDCFIKQIAKGLRYMHHHGVAHCDLKLENILLAYKEPRADGDGRPCANITLKISDFGKSNVFRTKFDAREQYLPRASGPLGSEPYMAPEEFTCQKSYSLAKKDCWALGIIILVLYNIRKHFYSGPSPVTRSDSLDSDYGSGYLWQTTDIKSHFSKKYKDRHFDEYVQTRQLAAYDAHAKEWTVHRAGAYRPIEELFRVGNHDEDDLCELRRMMLYKILDTDPGTRLSADEFLRGDWMAAVDNCI